MQSKKKNKSDDKFTKLSSALKNNLIRRKVKKAGREKVNKNP